MEADQENQIAPTTSIMEVEVEQLPSPVLRRLIEEVRHDIIEDISPYSRWHNRHNRSR
jgi:hypothetical protein